MLTSKLKSKRSKKTKKQAKQETPTLSIKERAAQKRKAAKERQELTKLITNAIFVAALLAIPLAFIGGIRAVLPTTLGILCLALSYKYPRQALYGFIIYVPIGGTITYYLGSSPVLQLAKDSFYVPALIGIWQSCRKQNLPLIIPQGIKIPLFILLGSCLITLIFVNEIGRASCRERV